MGFGNEITEYKLFYYGRRSRDAYAIAGISLYNYSNYLGNVLFYRDDQAIPNNKSVETGDPKLAYLRMHERQIDSVVDMLRNEKPCFVFYSTSAYAMIYSGKEPVGEEETDE